MKIIGRKIYFNNTGEVLLVTGELMGNVRETTLEEDIETYSELQGIEGLDFIQLQYGERANEFSNAGSMKVKNGELIIYPRITIQTDKTQIRADGIDTVTITSEQVEYFSVNSEGEYTVNPFLFSSTVEGIYTITAHSTLYGQNSVTIDVV